MTRFHINDSGETGRCGATKGKCPYGGEHQHYNSAEIARQAYELSMAAKAVPEAARASRPSYPIEGDEVVIHQDAGLHDVRFIPYEGQRARVESFNGSSYSLITQDGAKLGNMNYQLVELAPKSDSDRLLEAYSERLSKMSYADLEDEEAALAQEDGKSEDYSSRFETLRKVKADYYPSRYGGFQREDLVFDEEEQRERLLTKPNWAGASPERVDKFLATVRTNWEAQARVEPAKSHEDNVPIRLLPVGTEVYNTYKALSSRGRPYTLVGTPEDNGPVWDASTNRASGPNEIVGRYRDSTGAWDYVSPNTTFKLGKVPDKSLSPRWRHENERASRLAEQRKRVESDED